MVSTVAVSRLGTWAADALRQEAWLSPKPGLVDGRGRGAHVDMDVALMVRSADVLELWFGRLAEVSHDRRLDAELRTTLGAIGREAEADMLRVTGGVNTHRGALFSLGLLVAGAAAVGSTSAGAVTSAGAALARCPDLGASPEPDSHGGRARMLMPAAGALEQARAGFRPVIDAGLPALEAARVRGAPEAVAQLNALLALMAVVDDTCLLFRGGVADLRRVQAGAAAVLDAGGVETPGGRAAFVDLDGWMAERRLSPGGSGDLLAATLLLDTLGRGSCRN
jgi:triphosphoribosyl-dephospho-CoA synthase